MAKDNVIGIAMELDVADLKSGIQEVNKLVKKSKDEFNNSVAGLDKWNKSSEGLTAKLKQLDGQLSAQKKAVAGYEAEIERVSELEGDHSKELDNLKSKLSKAQAEVKKTESSLKYYGDSLATVTAEEKKANSELGKLTKKISDQKSEMDKLKDEYKNAVIEHGKFSKEAKAVKKQMENLNSEISKTEKVLDKSEKALNDVEDSFKSAGEKAKEFGKSTSDSMGTLEKIGTSGLKGIGILTGAVAGLATAFFSTADATKEYRISMGKLETSFETAGLTAEASEKIYKELYGVIGDNDKVVEASALLSQLVKDEKELGTWSDILTGVYAKFGDSLPIEALAEASNETAKTGKVTGVLADALNWTNKDLGDFGLKLKEDVEFTKLSEKELKKLTKEQRAEYDARKQRSEEIKKYNESVLEAKSNEEKFNIALENCTTEQERAELIARTLNDVYTESGEAYRENNKDLIESNETQAEMNETMAGFGELAEPIINDIKMLGVEILNSLLPVVEDLIPKIKDNLPEILANLGTFVALFGSLIAISKIYQAVTGAVTIAQGLLNVVMAANPITLIIIGITALVAAFVVLWKKCDWFRNFWIDLWDGITSVASTAWKAVTGFFSKSWETIKNTWSVVASFFSGIYESIVGFFKALPATLGGFFTTTWKNIKKAWDAVGDFFGDIKDTIVDTLSELPDKMLTIGGDLVKGLWNGIKDMTSWITGKLKDFAGDVLGGIKKFFGINSPSKETEEIGKYLDEGLAKGIEENSDVIEDSADSMGGGFLDKIKGFFGNFSFSNILSSLGEAGSKVFKWIAEKLGLNFGEKLDESLTENTKSAGSGVAKNLVNNTENIGKTIAENLSKELSDGVDSPTLKSRIESGLNKITEYFENWRNDTGRIILQVQGYFDSISNYVMNLSSSIGDYFSAITDNAITELDNQIDALQQASETEIAMQQEQTNAELANLEMKKQAGMLSEEQYALQVQQIQQSLSDFTELKKQEEERQEEELLKKKDELQRRQFEADKKNQTANVIVNTAGAIMRAFAELGWIAGAIASAMLTATSVAQIATINAQQYVPALAKGGIVSRETLALIGENGKEAVMPLENNTGWIDDLAGKISTIMNKDYLLENQAGNSTMNADGSSGRSTVNNYTQVINAPKTPSRRELYRDTRNLLTLKGV